MKHLFIPYGLAVIAKEKGFNEPCLKSITETGFENDYSILGAKNWNEIKGVVSIPLYQQIIDWFREKYMIEIHIRGCKKIGSFGGYQYLIADNVIVISKQNNFTEYYEAYNEAIEEAFKLI